MDQRVLLAGAAMLALAAADAARAADADQATTLPEVVVTARRVAEAAQRIPVAVTPVSGGALRQRTIRQLDDLVIAAPGLNIGQNPAVRRRASLVIRAPGLARTWRSPSIPRSASMSTASTSRAGRPCSSSCAALGEIGQVEVLAPGRRAPCSTPTPPAGPSSTSPASPRAPSSAAMCRRTWETMPCSTPPSGLNLPLGDRASLRLNYEHSQHDGYATFNADGRAAGERELRISSTSAFRPGRRPA